MQFDQKAFLTGVQSQRDFRQQQQANAFRQQGLDLERHRIEQARTNQLLDIIGKAPSTAALENLRPLVEQSNDPNVLSLFNSLGSNYQLDIDRRKAENPFQEFRDPDFVPGRTLEERQAEALHALSSLFPAPFSDEEMFQNAQIHNRMNRERNTTGIPRAPLMDQQGLQQESQKLQSTGGSFFDLPATSPTVPAPRAQTEPPPKAPPVQSTTSVSEAPSIRPSVERDFVQNVLDPKVKERIFTPSTDREGKVTPGSKFAPRQAWNQYKAYAKKNGQPADMGSFVREMYLNDGGVIPESFVPMVDAAFKRRLNQALSAQLKLVGKTPNQRNIKRQEVLRQVSMEFGGHLPEKLENPQLTKEDVAGLQFSNDFLEAASRFGVTPDMIQALQQQAVNKEPGAVEKYQNTIDTIMTNIPRKVDHLGTKVFFDNETGQSRVLTQVKTKDSRGNDIITWIDPVANDMAEAPPRPGEFPATIQSTSREEVIGGVGEEKEISSSLDTLWATEQLFNRFDATVAEFTDQELEEITGGAGFIARALDQLRATLTGVAPEAAANMVNDLVNKMGENLPAKSQRILSQYTLMLFKAAEVFAGQKGRSVTDADLKRIEGMISLASAGRLRESMDFIHNNLQDAGERLQLRMADSRSKRPFRSLLKERATRKGEPTKVPGNFSEKSDEELNSTISDIFSGR